MESQIIENVLNQKITYHFVKAEDVPIEKINLNSKPYQRTIEKAVTGRLIDNIKLDGYDRAKPVVLSEDPGSPNPPYSMVDGQHRGDAAIEHGMVKIPAIIYRFEDYKSEVLYYLKHNDWRHPIGNKNYWQTRYCAGDRLAKVLYDLNEDSECFLYHDVALQGQKTKYPFSISQAILLIMYALAISHPWNRALYNDKALLKLKNYTYIEIRKSINFMLQWIFDCFGKDKEIYPQAYRSIAFHAIIDIYRSLKDQHRLATEKSYKASIKRFTKFVFTPEFLATDLFGKKHMLCNWYNRTHGSGPKLRLED